MVAQNENSEKPPRDSGKINPSIIAAVEKSMKDDEVRRVGFIEMAMSMVRQEPAAFDRLLFAAYNGGYENPERIHKSLLDEVVESVDSDLRKKYVLVPLFKGDDVETIFLLRAMTVLSVSPDLLVDFIDDAKSGLSRVEFPSVVEFVLRSFVEDRASKKSMTGRGYLAKFSNSIFLLRAGEILRRDLNRFDYLMSDAFNNGYENPQALKEKLIELAEGIAGPERAGDFSLSKGDAIKGMMVDEIFLGRATRILLRDPSRLDDLCEEAFNKELPLAPLVTGRMHNLVKNIRETSVK